MQTAYWLVPLPRSKLVFSRDVTWGDVQACIAALNAASEDVFAGLHRCEGGFMCVEGPGFRSEERVDSGLPRPLRQRAAVHKEIRFAAPGGEADWPSHDHSFLGIPPDRVVFHAGEETHLRFEGEHCVPWTPQQCKSYSRVVSETLGLVEGSAASF